VYLRILAVLFALTPVLADDPAGVIVWKSSDLKQQAATQELQNARDYRVVVVHQDRDTEPVLGEIGAELLIVESGEATLVTGGKIEGASISNGAKTTLSEGDVIHIPGALPHQILVAPGKQITYVVIQQRANPGVEASPTAPAFDPNGRKPTLGADVGAGYRACVQGDTSPDGTIVDGFQKAISYNFMGKTCVWSPVDAPPSARANASTNLKEKPRLGVDMGSGFRSCVPGDDSPNGTIVDGYRKNLFPSPFGNSCAWEKIK
jgi:mannose-6-phosphate isomerase-like protein (cupin superfamily)